ncbi:hypothetical protein AAF712_008072 [Marasmius tenuissimus]|uniref:DNA-binding protein RAP1 n=1 Tax=Marasmius tenuissimus TaxID=585030 RepID=A0ABR2ZTE8_9AGAR
MSDEQSRLDFIDTEGRGRYNLALCQKPEHPDGVYGYLDAVNGKLPGNGSAAQRTTGEDTHPDVPVTQEEEERLVDYLAEHGSRNIKASIKGKSHYKTLVANEDGKTPWGTKHCADKWRQHFVENSERLHVLVLERRKKMREEKPLKGPYSLEEDRLLVDFLAVQKMKGASNLGDRKIYEELVKNEDGKWPWGTLRTSEAWRKRFIKTARQTLEPMVEARFAELLAVPSSPSRLSDLTAAAKLRDLPVGDVHSPVERRKEESWAKSSRMKFSPESERLFLEFLRKKKEAEGCQLGGITIDRELAENKDEKWPWGALRTERAWYENYFRNAHKSKPAVEEGLADAFTTSSSTPPPLPKPAATDELQVSNVDSSVGGVQPSKGCTSRKYAPEQGQLSKSIPSPAPAGVCTEHLESVACKKRKADDVQVEEGYGPPKRPKLAVGPAGPPEVSHVEDETELGVWTTEIPEMTFHLKTSGSHIAVSDLISTDEDLVEELEVESLRHKGFPEAWESDYTDIELGNFIGQNFTLAMSEQGPDLDYILVSYLAQNDAEGHARHELALYQKLAEKHRGGITASLWQNRYTRRHEHFDAMIKEKLRNGSTARGSTRKTGKDGTSSDRTVRPVTQEDEQALVAYLAEHGDYWNIRKAVEGKPHYKRLVANKDGKTPWGARHCADIWRQHVHNNWERLFALVLERRREMKVSRVGPFNRKWTLEDDELLAGFLAEKKAEGRHLGGHKIYEELVENKDGKWPWGTLRTQGAWNARYLQTARRKLEPMVEARLAELLAVGPSSSSLSKPSVATERHQLPVDAQSLAEGHAPSRVVPSKSGSRTWTSTKASVRSSSALVDVCMDDLLAAVTNDIPRHGLFSTQDDAVLLRYLIRLSGGSNVASEVDVFHHLLETVPDARKHTAQTWRKHYQRLKSRFDRLVEHFARRITNCGEGEVVADVQEERGPRKRRKVDSPRESMKDEPELGACTSGFPGTTFHRETSHGHTTVSDSDPTDQDLVEELEVEESLI